MEDFTVVTRTGFALMQQYSKLTSTLRYNEAPKLRYAAHNSLISSKSGQWPPMIRCCLSFLVKLDIAGRWLQAKMPKRVLGLVRKSTRKLASLSFEADLPGFEADYGCSR